MTTSMSTAILGCGAMSGVVFKHFAKTKVSDPFRFYTYTPSQIRAKELADKLGGTFCPELKDVPACELYFLACKPQQFKALASELRPQLQNLWASSISAPKEIMFLSVMASITAESIDRHLGLKDLEKLGVSSSIVRAMPNTPMAVQEGLTLLYYPENLPQVHKAMIESLFKAQGTVVEVSSEEEMDLITGISGSGPAYVFEMASVMLEVLHNRGISPFMAELIVKQTLFGASKLYKEGHLSADNLRDQVTSQKGITFEALEVLRLREYRGMFKDALDRAYQRTKELVLK